MNALGLYVLTKINDNNNDLQKEKFQEDTLIDNISVNGKINKKNMQ